MVTIFVRSFSVVLSRFMSLKVFGSRLSPFLNIGRSMLVFHGCVILHLCYIFWISFCSPIVSVSPSRFDSSFCILFGPFLWFDGLVHLFHSYLDILSNIWCVGEVTFTLFFVTLVYFCWINLALFCWLQRIHFYELFPWKSDTLTF